MEVFQVKKIHGLVFKLGLDLDMYVGSSLVSSYLKSELMKDARELFDEMPERDVVLWNSMVNGYAQIGQFDEALRVCREMSQEGVLMSKFTVSGVLSVFSVRGDFANGRLVHGFMIKMGFDSCVSVCNALIDMYGKCRRAVDALEIFEKMNEKDIFSWNSILSANEHCCDHDGTLRLFDRMLERFMATLIVNGFIKDGESENMYNLQTINALMDMYAKCGSMRDAEMSGLKPNEITFVGVLLACSHAGFISQGSKFLVEMELKHGVVPTIQHYTCVIDMLGRAGKLEEAYKLAVTMPIQGQSSSGRYQEVLDIRHKMRQQDVKKTPGCSWIELKNGMNTFINGDRTHPEARLIYPELHLLAAHIHEHGYVPLL
uniref:DYW domain-containing protein n=1 Tax=Salix viminalis TaxID=40686 RepID=A0A6N2KKB0_SALVM